MQIRASHPHSAKPCQSSHVQLSVEAGSGHAENRLLAGSCALIHMIGRFCEWAIVAILHLTIEVQLIFLKAWCNFWGFSFIYIWYTCFVFLILTLLELLFSIDMKPDLIKKWKIHPGWWWLAGQWSSWHLGLVSFSSSLMNVTLCTSGNWQDSYCHS